MVNGNYIVYGDRPASDSEIVDDHVHTRTSERKVKRKPNRTANELQHSLSLAQIDNETDSIKYEKRVKEPRLLRYVPTTDVEENYISEKFETYDMKPTEERPRRYAFTKKPKNPADGSVNYAHSRSSSSCSSPNGNLPTISEHGEQYGTYRVRTTSPQYVSEVIPTYENKLEKYFAKPREVKKFAAKGSHPDSLYRVPVDEEVGSSKLVRVLRVMRWPIALFLVCVALAVFVYFLMPDNLDSDQDKVNSTHWQSDPVAVEAVHFRGPFVTEAPTLAPTIALRHRKKGNQPSPHPATTKPKGTKISEIDFYDPVIDKNEVSSPATSGPVVPTRKLPVPPVFPSLITPEVQYGNERVDVDKLRIPKVLDEKNLEQEDSTLKPHITQKPEKPLAVSFKDAITITSPSTETVFKAETNNDLTNYGEKYTTIVDEAPIKTQLPIYKDHRPLYIQEYKSNVNNKQKQIVPEVPRYYGQQPLDYDVNFTSGHSKIFGLSIEDAGKMRSTTQSSVYNTRVSPTLPTWKNKDDTTTKKYPVNVNSEAPLCRSTRLALCRGVLPYDLAGAPAKINNVEVTVLLPQIEYLAATNCSQRLQEFACALLEPECSPFPDPGQLPCQSLCRAIVDSCESLIPQELAAMFNCEQFARTECVTAKAPCNKREFPCADGSCMPRDWICDGNQDCPSGEDERQCALCALTEYKCRTGGCILKRWLCDGYVDCAGGEDEADETCESLKQEGATAADLGEHASASAPAPAVRRPSRMPSKHWTGDNSNDSSKELLITSDSNSALKRNFTRRPSPSRLTPYSRPMLKTKTTTLKPMKLIEMPEYITTTGIPQQNKVDAEKSKTNDSLEVIELSDVFLDFEELNKEEKKGKVPSQMKKAGAMVPGPEEVEEPVSVSTHVDKTSNTLNRFINGADLMKKTKDVEIEATEPESLEANSTFMEKDENPGSLTSHSSPCPNGELRCVDGRCITLEQLCDGTIDCSDHADEDNCYA
ncbi:uncharacterized protein LOC128674813 isoform X2 [Plodia interpunctella]|uniref:uncharacterized protein LOC128674813 isoform X2 n=1 Tax=Plodia interpunctella TaxID=58824 RepID=UPI002368A36F|nr:uncharacterized protein LOC128674813 isoform X2 [Plodia interpunctella]